MSMKKRISYILFLLVALIINQPTVNAQDDKYKDIIKPDGIKNKKYFVTLTGIGDVEVMKPINVNLGMSVSAGLRILYKPKIKAGKSSYSPRIVEREIFIKPTFGYIYRKRYNTAIFFIPELAYRHTLAKGVFLELNFDAGYMYTKMNAPTYERQTDGTFKKVSFGFHNIIVGGKLMAGYDFSKKHKTPIAINFGPNIFYRFPNNNKWVRHIALEMGISYVFRKIKE
jgi:hypothetical protein